MFMKNKLFGDFYYNFTESTWIFTDMHCMQVESLLSRCIYFASFVLMTVEV